MYSYATKLLGKRHFTTMQFLYFMLKKNRGALKTNITHGFHVNNDKAYIINSNFYARKCFLHALLRMNLFVFYICVWKDCLVKMNLNSQSLHCYLFSVINVIEQLTY